MLHLGRLYPLRSIVPFFDSLQTCGVLVYTRIPDVIYSPNPFVGFRILRKWRIRDLAHVSNQVAMGRSGNESFLGEHLTLWLCLSKADPDGI